MNRTHGLSRLKKIVDTRGMKVLDGRSYAVRAVREWEEELVRDLGGAENLSVQKRTLVEMACKTRLYIEHVDSWLCLQPSIVYNRKHKLMPVVQQRQQLVDSLAKLLDRLGLDRVPKPIPTLAEYLAESEKESSRDEEPEPEPDAA